MKTITVDGRRYRLSTKSYYPGRVFVEGKGILSGLYLPDGITMNDPGLRDEIRAAVARYRQDHKAASEAVQSRVRNGTAGIDYRPRESTLPGRG